MCVIVSVCLCVATKPSSILDDDDEGVTPIIIPTTSSKHKPPVTSSAQPSIDVDTAKPASAIDITADDILPRLTSPNVTDLVLLSMVMSAAAAALLLVADVQRPVLPFITQCSVDFFLLQLGEYWHGKHLHSEIFRVCGSTVDG